MKLIDASTPKHPNFFAMVDDEDYENLNQWKWRPFVKKHTTYLKRSKTVNGSEINVSMHREILSPPNGITVDHIDGNGLNNQRSNLRLATHSENNRNRNKPVINKSGYIGVSWEGGSWRAQIKVNRKTHRVACSQDIIQAAKARDAAAIKYHGEFARLNFPISNLGANNG